MKDIRKLLVHIDENNRECDCCKTSLSYKDDTIIVVVPRGKELYEYCGWYCMFTGIKRLLQEKLLNSKLCQNNLLSKLKYTGSEKEVQNRLKNYKSEE